MHIEAYLNGILPRSDKALQIGSSLLKGGETKENFDNILKKETKEFIQLQENLGFNYIFDGQLLWDDFLRPIAVALTLHSENSDANENPVTRQIYTNTFYRKPLILKKVSDTKSLIDEKYLNLIQKGKRKVIFPSPFALLYLSDGIHRNENTSINDDIFKELLFDIAKVFNHEAKRLEKNGVSFIQFSDPCMVYAEETKSFWDSIVESLKIATKDIKAVTSLHLYNGDLSKLPKLFDIPVDRIGLDPYTTDLKIFESFDKFLELGIVNSKNSLIEQPETIAKYAEQVIEKLNPDGLALVPNRPLELVPQEIAIKKIESLAKAAQLLK